MNAAPSIRDRIVDVRRVRAGDLLPHPMNPRGHPDAQRRAVSGSLASFGQVAPLIAFTDADGALRLVDGHLRASLHPDAEVKVAVTDLSPEEARAVLAVLDPSAALAEVDAELLASLQAMVTLDVEAGLLSVSEDLDALLASVTAPVVLQGDPDEIPQAVAARCKAGEVWECGAHRIGCLDSSDAEAVARLLGGVPPALIVTSPPYNQGIDKFRPSGMHKEGDWVAKVERLAYADSLPEDEYQRRQRALLELWHGLLRDGGSVFYNHKNRYREKRVVSPLEWLPGPFALRQEIVWSRPGSVTQNARMFIPSDERIYWLYKGDDFFFRDTTEIKSLSTVWDVALEANKTHAAAFPAELPRRCIQACSERGEAVYDPFLGSGTTLIAAELEGRICYGSELDSAVVDIALARWENLTGQQAHRNP